MQAQGDNLSTAFQQLSIGLRKRTGYFLVRNVSVVSTKVTNSFLQSRKYLEWWAACWTYSNFWPTHGLRRSSGRRPGDRFGRMIRLVLDKYQNFSNEFFLGVQCDSDLATIVTATNELLWWQLKIVFLKFSSWKPHNSSCWVILSECAPPKKPPKVAGFQPKFWITKSWVASC